jgi:hypothetical protein
MSVGVRANPTRANRGQLREWPKIIERPPLGGSAIAAFTPIVTDTGTQETNLGNRLLYNAALSYRLFG